VERGITHLMPALRLSNTKEIHLINNLNVLYLLVHGSQYVNAVLVICQLKGVAVNHTQVVYDPCQT